MTPTEQDSGKQKEHADALKNWHIYTMWYDLQSYYFQEEII